MIEQKPKIKSIAPWFGGKRMLAGRIVAELGTHDQYFEPFCGSMAVLLSKKPSRNETVNDLHGDLINLARVVADADLAPRLYGRLQGTPVCEGLLTDARHQLESVPPAAPDGDRAYWYFLVSWMARNGTSGTDRVDYQIAVRWTLGGGSPTVRWRNAVESLPAWHVRLQNVVILCRDAFRILDRFEDAVGTAIYVDPPYPTETRSGNGQHRYLHEFLHNGSGLFDQSDDHARLAECLRQYKRAKVVVSSYDCPRIRELYEGWLFIDCAMRKNLAQASGGKSEASEVLIVNV